MTDEWEIVHKSERTETLRLRVPSGWLYWHQPTFYGQDRGLTGHMVFVPADEERLARDRRLAEAERWAEEYLTNGEGYD